MNFRDCITTNSSFEEALADYSQSHDLNDQDAIIIQDSNFVSKNFIYTKSDNSWKEMVSVNKKDVLKLMIDGSCNSFINSTYALIMKGENI